MGQEVKQAVRAAAIEVLKLLREKPQAPEAIVRQAIVQRFLQAAGFDILNTNEVLPEEVGISGHRPDYLVIGKRARFALEVKAAGVQFKPKEYQQALNYATGQGIRWAILTNGRLWILIDERAHGKPEERERLRLELTEDNLDSFSRDLAAILDKQVWDRGIMSVVNIELTQRDKFVEGTDQAEIFIDGGVVEQGTLHFTLKLKGAHAQAVYKPSNGTWTVIAGSTALNRKRAVSDKGMEKRRNRYLAEGRMKVSDDDPNLLVYLEDIVCASASTAAQDVTGGGVNGWDIWIDSDGNPAQKYKPTYEQLVTKRGSARGRVNFKGVSDKE